VRGEGFSNATVEVKGVAVGSVVVVAQDRAEVLPHHRFDGQVEAALLRVGARHEGAPRPKAGVEVERSAASVRGFFVMQASS
jgi:hypothetical protein